jgi:hypothetical protein
MNSQAQQRGQDVGEIMGLVGQRRQLVAEMEELQERRLEIAQQLKTAGREERGVLQQTANQLDRQLSGAENALRAIETLIATQTGAAPPPPTAPRQVAPPAGGQGFSYTTAPPPPPADPGWAKDMVALSTGTLAIVALAALAAFGYLRRMRRDTQDAVVQLRSELWQEMKKVSVGVDAIAVELERIGEGQRFVTKALSEKKEPAPRGGSS